MPLSINEKKASPRRQPSTSNSFFQFSIFKKQHSSSSSPQRHKDHLEQLEQQSELLEKGLNNKACEAIINHEEDDEMVITGYKRSKTKTAITFVFFILTCGLLRLIMHWYKHWLLLTTHKKCPLDTADRLLITEQYEGKHSIYYVKDVITLSKDNLNEMQKNPQKWSDFLPLGEPTDPMNMAVHFSGGVFKTMESMRIFKCKQLRYVWDEQSASFIKLKGLDTYVPSIVLHQHKGLSLIEQYSRRLVYGSNVIYIPLKSVLTLLFLEALNPFYVFQVFSVILWFSYNYYYFATVIILMSAFGITMSIIQTRKNQQALFNTVMSSDCATVINSDGEANIVETKYLVPGDILEIPSSGCTMQCDAVLLSGNAILDESMLTGESVPVTKTPLPCLRDLMFDQKEHARHVLFCGTKVIQTRYIGSEKVLAIVINTGNITAKGGLVRSILYPPPVDYKFESDSYKFISLLALVAFIGFIYTLVTKILRGVPGVKIAVESLDLITIAVPPALPAAMSVGRFYAQKRLEKKQIYCISPRSINVAGSIDCVCFDKTGTLTEDGLDMWGVVPKASTNYFQIPLRQIERLPYDNLLFGMVTCHSITIIGGELKGDPLDLKMFESTGWILEEANVADTTKYDLLFPTLVRPPRNSGIMISDSDTGEGAFGSQMDIGIVREFSFTSSLQRMSVITRRLMDTNYNVYCKGSPEMISTLCRPETIPVDFNSTLEDYAQQGYRIIAIAYKQLDKKVTYAKVQRIARDKIEMDLEFQGLVIMENRLKNDTTEIIEGLMAANIRTVMVTGDNMLTALSVARDCDMITSNQSVIIVNARQDPNDEDKYELYYNLSGTTGRQNIANNTTHSTGTQQMPNGFGGSGDNGGGGGGGGVGGDYALMTNSNSVASLETIDTCTHTTQITIRDIEAGYTQENMKNNFNYNDDNNPLRLVPELPCNNYRFAMVGKTWQIIRDEFPDLLPKFVTRGTVFARMSPDQKQALVLELQDLGYYVAMCGDGANDCGALKAAHTGISLSEAESSVASPFTSKKPTIACVPLVVKEGRAALVTSVGIFKYMAAYSLVQFASVLILYSIDSNLTDIEFLYIDLFIIAVFAFFFGKTESSDGPLVNQTPLSSLVSLSPILSLACQLTLAIGIQVIAYQHLKMQTWFEAFVFVEDSHLGCYENYTIFSISCFQYIILAIVFSKGKPYRKSIFTNYGFLLSITLNLAVIVCLVLSPPEFIRSFFQLFMPPEMRFRIYMVLYGFCNFIIALFIEVVIIDSFVFKKLRYRFHNIEKSRRKFLAVEAQLRQDLAWPPLSMYQTFSQDNGEKELSANTFAEIHVESGVDSGPPFDKNNSVLNSFFEHDLTIATETPTTNVDVDHEIVGLMQRIDEVDNNGTIVHNSPKLQTPTPQPQPPPPQSSLLLSQIEQRNDSGIDLETIPTATLLPIERKRSSLVINLQNNNDNGDNENYNDENDRFSNHKTRMAGPLNGHAANNFTRSPNGIDNKNISSSLELSNMSTHHS